MSCTIGLWKQREIGVTDLDSYALNIDIRCIFSLSVSLFLFCISLLIPPIPRYTPREGVFSPSRT